MNKKMLFSAVAISVPIAFSIPAVQAAPPMNFTYNDDFFYTDTCLGENIHFVGITTFASVYSITNDIGHLVGHINVRDDGTGLTTGGSYKINEEDNFTQNFQLVEHTGETNEILNASIIGHGAVANENIKETFHVTVNANGTMTVDRSDFSMNCHN